MPPKKKNTSLLKMILRNRKDHNVASSSVAQSTPLNSPDRPQAPQIPPREFSGNNGNISEITSSRNEVRGTWESGVTCPNDRMDIVSPNTMQLHPPTQLTDGENVQP